MAVPAARRCTAQKRNRADHSGNAARSAQRRAERAQRIAARAKPKPTEEPR